MSNQVQIIQPDTAMSVLELFSTSKASCEIFAEQVLTEIREGHADPLRVQVLIKSMEKCIEMIQPTVKEYALREAEKHGTNSFEFAGAKVEIAPTKTEYDYLNTGDPIWHEAMMKEKQGTGERKDREAFLRTLKEPMDVRVDDVLVTIKPPVKAQTNGLKITIK